MKFVKYKSKKEFLNENLEILLKEESKNELMLGIILEHKDEKVNNWLLGRLENNNEVKMIFLSDDDKEGLLFYCPTGDISKEEIEFLIDNILDLNINLNQVFGDKRFSRIVAKIYTEKSKKIIIENSVIYTLALKKLKQEHILEENEKLIKLNSENADMEKMSQIVKDIHTDISGVEACSDEEALRIANIYLKKGLYILTDINEKDIFCHAVTVRKQINGCTIGAVISPKEFRGKGYGKKCIYAVSKILLEEGYNYITLHVLSTNEAAKSVYEKVGYEFLEETERFVFSK